MKTLKQTVKRMALIVAVVLISAPTFANNSSNEKKFALEQNQKIELTKVLDMQVEFPEEARKNGITGTVKAELEVTAEGKLNIKAINGNPELLPSVKAQVAKINIEDYTLVGKTFIAQFKFSN